MWVGVRVAWASMLRNAYFQGFLFDVQISANFLPGGRATTLKEAKAEYAKLRRPAVIVLPFLPSHVP